MAAAGVDVAGGAAIGRDVPCWGWPVSRCSPRLAGHEGFHGNLHRTAREHAARPRGFARCAFVPAFSEQLHCSPSQHQHRRRSDWQLYRRNRSRGARTRHLDTTRHCARCLVALLRRAAPPRRLLVHARSDAGVRRPQRIAGNGDDDGVRVAGGVRPCVVRVPGGTPALAAQAYGRCSVHRARRHGHSGGQPCAQHRLAVAAVFERLPYHRFHHLIRRPSYRLPRWNAICTTSVSSLRKRRAPPVSWRRCALARHDACHEPRHARRASPRTTQGSATSMSLGLYLALGAVFVLLFVLERVFPARREAFDAGWTLRALAINLVQLGTMCASPSPSTRGWHRTRCTRRPMASPAGRAAAAIVGSLIQYVAPRCAQERFPWRVFHRCTTARPHRHPRDELFASARLRRHTAIHASRQSSCSAWGRTQSPGRLHLWRQQLLRALQLRSPRWVGYVLQRPEMHRLHHNSTTTAELRLSDGACFCVRANPPTHGDYACGFGGPREAARQTGARAGRQRMHAWRTYAVPAGLRRWLIASAIFTLGGAVLFGAGVCAAGRARRPAARGSGDVSRPRGLDDADVRWSLRLGWRCGTPARAWWPSCRRKNCWRLHAHRGMAAGGISLHRLVARVGDLVFALAFLICLEFQSFMISPCSISTAPPPRAKCTSTSCGHAVDPAQFAPQAAPPSALHRLPHELLSVSRSARASSRWLSRAWPRKRCDAPGILRARRSAGRAAAGRDGTDRMAPGAGDRVVVVSAACFLPRSMVPLARLDLVCSHLESRAAKLTGLAGAQCVGPEKHAWCAHVSAARVRSGVRLRRYARGPRDARHGAASRLPLGAA